MNPITTTEWLAELQRLSNRKDEGLTAKEWAEAMDCSHDCALKRLNQARELGWLKVGRRRTTAIDGRPSMAPVYQIVRPKS